MNTKFEINQNEDIAVFGRIVSMSEDNVVASAAQIWDDDFSTNGMMQNEINKKFADDISAMSSDIVEIGDRVSTLENKDVPVATTNDFGIVKLATGRGDANDNSVVTIGILKGITEGADESFDTLKEISNYLKSNPNTSNLLNLLSQKANASDLTALATRVSTLETKVNKNINDIAYLLECCEEMKQSQGGGTDSFTITTTFGTGTTATNTEQSRTITAGSTYTNTFSLLDGYKNLTVTITDGNDNVLFSGSSESGNVVATVENVTTALVVSVSAIEDQGGDTEQNNVLSFDAAGTTTSRTENVSSNLTLIQYELYWNGTKLTGEQASGVAVESDNWISTATSEQLGTYVNVSANQTDSTRSGQITFTYHVDNIEAPSVTMYINQSANSSGSGSGTDEPGGNEDPDSGESGTKYTITPKSAIIRVGDTLTLTGSSNAAIGNWASTNTSVATVDRGTSTSTVGNQPSYKKPVVTGVGEGTTTIYISESSETHNSNTIRSNGGEMSITVIPANANLITGVSLNNLDVTVGTTGQLSYNIELTGGTGDYTVTYEIENEDDQSIISVDENGVVTGLSEGDATVKVIVEWEYGTVEGEGTVTVASPLFGSNDTTRSATLDLMGNARYGSTYETSGNFDTALYEFREAGSEDQSDSYINNTTTWNDAEYKPTLVYPLWNAVPTDTRHAYIEENDCVTVDVDWISAEVLKKNDGTIQSQIGDVPSAYGWTGLFFTANEYTDAIEDLKQNETSNMSRTGHITITAEDGSKFIVTLTQVADYGINAVTTDTTVSLNPLPYNVWEKIEWYGDPETSTFTTPNTVSFPGIVRDPEGASFFCKAISNIDESLNRTTGTLQAGWELLATSQEDNPQPIEK